MAWVLIATFNQIYSKNLGQKSKQKILKSPEGTTSKVGAKRNMLSKEISGIKKTLSILYRNKDTDTLRTLQKSVQPYPSEAQGYKSINLPFQKKVLGLPAPEGFMGN